MRFESEWLANRPQQVVANFQGLGIFCLSSVRPRQNSRNGKIAVQVDLCGEFANSSGLGGNKSYC
jgi:hypothetical protein